MELYLATNYTRCPNRTSFLETKEFMTGTEHILTVICVPLNIYCFYLIWYVTPKKMEGVKLAMLHLQLVSLLFDLITNSLLTLVAYLPAPVASFHGLFSFLGVPHKFQLLLCEYNIFLIGMSLINIFQNRHSATTSIPYRFMKTSSLVIYYTLCYMFGAIVISLCYIENFDSDALKLEYLKIYPCPPLEYFESTASALSNNLPLKEFTYMSGIVFILSNAFYFVLSTVYYLVIAPSSTVSAKTRQMQLRFLIILSIQIAIPMTGLVVPCSFIILMLITGFNSQIANNIFILMYCSHGLLSGVALIFVQKPYREYTFRFLDIARNKISSVEPTVTLVRPNIIKGTFNDVAKLQNRNRMWFWSK